MKINVEMVPVYEPEATDEDRKEILRMLRKNGVKQNIGLTTGILELIEKKGSEAIELYIKHRKSLKHES